MGQRHQIYLRTIDDADGKTSLVGIHHQWLFGSNPIRRLTQFLAFAAKQADDELGGTFAGNYDGGRTARKALAALYSFDMTLGVFDDAVEMDESFGGGEPLKDPRVMDNNDGITIIDLTDRKAPKFAFLFPHACDPSVAKADQMRPLGAYQYLEQYYDIPTKVKGDDRKAPHGSWAMAAKLDNTYQRLTKAEVKKIFPAMFRTKKA